jgi:hypothetical protein
MYGHLSMYMHVRTDARTATRMLKESWDD